MKKLMLAAVAVAMALAAGAAQAQEKMKVRMGTEGAYPPFNFIDKNGKLAGFDIEIGDALCAAADLDCEWITQDWDGIIPGLQAEKYDTILASMSITEERKQVVDFTSKYYLTPAALIGKEGTELKGSLKETVSGGVVGVQSATTHENYVRDNFGEVAEVRSYDTVEQAHLDLSAGRIDYFMDDIIAVTDGFLKTDLGKGFAVIGDPVAEPRWHGEGAGIAIRKGEDELRDRLNAAIQKIREDGTYQKINAKYFDFDVFGG